MTLSLFRNALYLRHFGINSTFVLPALAFLVLPQFLKTSSTELAVHWHSGMQIGNIIAATTMGFGMIAARAANEYGGHGTLNHVRRIATAVTLLTIGLMMTETVSPISRLHWRTTLALATPISILLGQVVLTQSTSRASVRRVAHLAALYRAFPVVAALGLCLMLTRRMLLSPADRPAVSGQRLEVECHFWYDRGCPSSAWDLITTRKQPSLRPDGRLSCIVPTAKSRG